MPLFRQRASSSCHTITQALGWPATMCEHIHSFVGGPRQCGLKVRNLVTVWKQQQSIKLNLLEASADKRCQFLAKSISDRQSNWARKFAPAREAQIAKTVVLANSESAAPFHPTVTTDPPLSPRSTRKRVNQYIHDIDVAEQLEHLRTLQVQGKWLQWSERMHQDLSWQQLIHNWSDAELRFALSSDHRHCTISPQTFDGGASPTLIQPAVSAGNQPPLVTFSMLVQLHSNKAGTPGDTTPCFLSSVTICTSSGSFRPLNVPLR